MSGNFSSFLGFVLLSTISGLVAVAVLAFATVALGIDPPEFLIQGIAIVIGVSVGHYLQSRRGWFR